MLERFHGMRASDPLRVDVRASPSSGPPDALRGGFQGVVLPGPPLRSRAAAGSQIGLQRIRPSGLRGLRSPPARHVARTGAMWNPRGSRRAARGRSRLLLLSFVGAGKDRSCGVGDRCRNRWKDLDRAQLDPWDTDRQLGTRGPGQPLPGGTTDSACMPFGFAGRFRTGCRRRRPSRTVPVRSLKSFFGRSTQPEWIFWIHFWMFITEAN